MCNSKLCFCSFSVLICLASLAYYYGALQQIQVYDAYLPNAIFYYKSTIGPYEDLSKQYQKIHQITAPLSLSKYKGYGMSIYYDDPKQLKEGAVPRSDIGFAFPSKIIEDVDAKLLSYGFKKAELPEAKVLQTYFPFKGFPSIILNVLISYPAIGLEESKEERKDFVESPIIEICKDGVIYTSVLESKMIEKYMLTPYSKPEQKIPKN